MNVFTSDLDRTLIYSKRTIGAQGNIRCIEQLEGEDLSYMTTRSIELLKEIQNHTHFVPVTTRSQLQYERISVFQNEITPKFAIVANGGIVLKEGKRDQQWDELVAQRLATESVSFEEFKTRFKNIRNSDFFLRELEVESLFYMLRINPDKLNMDELTNYMNELSEEGWASFLHGTKFYALPFALTKEAAVAYVLSQIDYEEHFAAGDSLMDLGMLKEAKVGFTPLHGEIYAHYKEQVPVQLIAESGATFTEVILEKICKRLVK